MVFGRRGNAGVNQGVGPGQGAESNAASKAGSGLYYAFHYLSLFDWIQRIVITCALFSAAEHYISRGDGYHANRRGWFMGLFWFEFALHMLYFLVYPCLRTVLARSWRHPWWLAVLQDIMVMYSVFSYVALAIFFVRPYKENNYPGDHFYYMTAFMAVSALYVIVNAALGYVLFLAHYGMPADTLGNGVYGNKNAATTKAGPLTDQPALGQHTMGPAHTTTTTHTHNHPVPGSVV